MEDQHHETQTLHHHLKSTNEAVEELKQENSSLQHQINENQRAPVSSTPFRPSAPSLQEELANSDIPNGMSPVILMNSSIDDLMDSIDQGNKPGNDEDDVFKKLALNVSVHLSVFYILHVLQSWSDTFVSLSEMYFFLYDQSSSSLIVFSL